MVNRTFNVAYANHLSDQAETGSRDFFEVDTLKAGMCFGKVSCGQSIGSPLVAYPESESPIESYVQVQMQFRCSRY
jgi:tRNA(Ile)-lysidine synthase TilS/MesJ